MDSDESRNLDRLAADGRRAKAPPATLEQEARAFMLMLFAVLVVGTAVGIGGWGGLFGLTAGLAGIAFLYCPYRLILLGVQAWDERGR